MHIPISRILFVLLIFQCLLVKAQTREFRGQVVDQQGSALQGASVLINGTTTGTISDLEGQFELFIPEKSVTLLIKFVGFKDKLFPVDSGINLSDIQLIGLEEQSLQLEGVRISQTRIQDDQVTTVQKIDARSAKSLPSTFGDFNKILITLPGVSSNNELSSAYSVRGGNFAENLVYVNDIPIYRPFLANAGRQEGLSFVNPDMVKDIEFYAGGWEAKYGDKLSSSLNIEYKEPDSLEASVTVGLLGGTAYSGDQVGRVSYTVGVRHRDSRYLLNTLETKGQYFPTYSDVQGLITVDLTKKSSYFLNKTKLNILLAYGRNRYLTEPQSQSTEFGSVQQNFRLQTAFQGREILRYDTYQTGFRLTHRFADRIRTHLIGSLLLTQEKEQFDVEGAYRLCDVNNDPSSSAFDQCVTIRGIGTNYDYGRNSLKANLWTIEDRWEFLINNNHVFEAGFGIQSQNINDQLNEYAFLDSADYIRINYQAFNESAITAQTYYGYVQQTLLWGDSVHALSAGVRFSQWSYNGQLLVSPRIAYRLAPKWEHNTTFKLSAGLYQQHPFYRELRDRTGSLQSDVYAQRSIHLMGGMTRLFYMWGRPFLFHGEMYYKFLSDIIPYDIDNVRLRYFAQNNATGYATGLDFRINGEFVKGTQSWFSVSLLQTKEDIDDDGQGLIRRPTDQRLNIAAYFEDHMPHDPTLRVYLNLVLGSGYPFGPPNRAELRNAFSGDEYYRADIGISKMFQTRVNKLFHKAWIRLELLNALGADNTLSYTWIQDVNGNQFAIPNSLSARFLNIKFTAEL